MVFIECPICLDEKDSYVTLICGHQFCNYCINEYAKQSKLNKCPLCRTSIITGLPTNNNQLENYNQYQYNDDNQNIDEDEDDDEESVINSNQIANIDQRQRQGQNYDCNGDQECYLNIISAFFGLIIVIFIVLLIRIK